MSDQADKLARQWLNGEWGSSAESLAQLLRSGGNTGSALLNVKLQCEPIPKRRPRFMQDKNGRTVRTYSDQEDKQQDFAWMIHCFAPKFKMQEKGVTLAIELVFNTTRKSVDIDNLVKFVLDAGNGFLWEDDRQIEKLVARMNRVERDPSVEIVLHRT